MIIHKDRQQITIESDAEIEPILAHIENSLENRAIDGEQETPDYEDLEFLQGLFQEMQTGKHPMDNVPLYTTAFDIFCGVVWEQLLDDDPEYWGQGCPNYGDQPKWTIYGRVTIESENDCRLMIAALHGMMDNHWDMRGDIGLDTYHENEAYIEAITEHMQSVMKFPATLTMPSKAYNLFWQAKDVYLPHTEL